MLTKLLNAWAKVSKNEESLARALRDVGHACASMDPEPLRELRNHFATARVKGEKAEGMMIAAVEIIDGLRDARSQWLQEIEPSLERRDGLHMRILTVLESGQAAPTGLQTKLKARLTDVSAALKKLQQSGLVHEPTRGVTDARQRFYSLTPRGREMAKQLGLKAPPELTADVARPSASTRPELEPALRANASGPRARSVNAKTIELFNRTFPKQDDRRKDDVLAMEDRFSAS